MIRLFHVSDVHFGAEDHAAIAWFSRLVADERLAFHLVTVLGASVALGQHLVSHPELVDALAGGLRRTSAADLRRERLDVDDNSKTRRTGSNTYAASDTKGSGAADRATNSGPLDRLADKADNLKDRVDGNPASKPGPDATDRRI